MKNLDVKKFFGEKLEKVKSLKKDNKPKVTKSKTTRVRKEPIIKGSDNIPTKSKRSCLEVLKDMKLTGVLVKKKVIISAVTTVAIGIVAVAGVFASDYVTGKASAETSTVGNYLEETVEKGTILVGVTEMGSSEMLDTAVTYDFTAEIEEVYVKAGQYVETGTILAKMDTEELLDTYEDLELQLSNAQLSLESAQLSADSSELSASSNLSETEYYGVNAAEIYSLTIKELENAAVILLNEIDDLEEEVEELENTYNSDYSADYTSSYDNSVSTLEAQLKTLEAYYDAVKNCSYASGDSSSQTTYDTAVSDAQKVYEAAVTEAESIYDEAQKAYDDAVAAADYNDSTSDAATVLEDAATAKIDAVATAQSALETAKAEALTALSNSTTMTGACSICGCGSAGENTVTAHSDALQSYELQIIEKEGEITAAENNVSQAEENYEDSRESLENEIESVYASIYAKYLDYETYQITIDTKTMDADATYAEYISEYETMYAEYNILMAQNSNSLESYQKAVDEIAEELAEMDVVVEEEGIIVAPCDGYIMTLTEEGSSVTAGYSIITMADKTAVDITVSIAQEDIGDISIGMDTYIVFDAYDDISVPAAVDSISIVPSSGMSSSVYYTVYIQCNITDYPDMVIYEGMTADVTFIQRQEEDVLLVSSKCITNEDGKTYVKQINELGEVVMVEVETGFSDGFDVEIISGVEEGDVVIIESVVG